MACRIKCSKGSKKGDSIELVFEGKDSSVTDFEDERFLSLRNVRDRLVAEGFIGNDAEHAVWRFVVENVASDEKKKTRYSDRILGTEAEELYPAKRLFINERNEIVITNVDKSGRPDLIGFATDYFNNGKIKVWCRLRDYVEGDEDANKGKFQPVMLTDVITTRESDDVNYKFACICCEDSVLEFPVESYGTVGIVIRAELDNTIIYDSAVHWAPFDKKLYGCGSVNCMKRPEDKEVHNITVKNVTKDTGVVPGTALRYQKITIYTQDLLSWYDIPTKTTFTENTQRPLQNMGTAAKTLAVSGKLNGMHALSASADSKKQIELPGGSYDPGEITEGAAVEFGCGQWYVRDVGKEKLGSVSIYMFVFKTLEDAEKIIGRYNVLTENAQASFWNR